MKIRRDNITLTFGLLLVAQNCCSLPAVEVEATIKPGEPWQVFPTRTLSDIGTLTNALPDAGLSQYGGITGRCVKATGFFRTEKVKERWWLVDPEGCLFIYRGVASVRTTDTPGASAALTAKFGSDSNWAEGTVALLRQHGFNGVGGWSDTTALRKVNLPLVYTRLWNFMSSYGRKRGGTFQQPGHTGYPDNCIFIFDPEFEQFCDDYARALTETKDDPWLLGHFSDNEMPLPREALRNYLKLPPTDPGYQAARKFLETRHGIRASAEDITTKDVQDFHEFTVGRYFEIVSRAIRKYDPHHLYLGARLYGADLRYPEVFKACGRHVDVVSVNWYRTWTPDAAKLAMWERESGRPLLITEWYAKGADAGMANKSGAGWLVRTQRDRGLFYQNFVLALLESRVCVGWDWFRYMDNDPEDKKVDPSNRDSNKGIVNNRYVPYEPLLSAMKELNECTIAVVDHFDGDTKKKPGVRLANEKQP